MGLLLIEILSKRFKRKLHTSLSSPRHRHCCVRHFWKYSNTPRLEDYSCYFAFFKWIFAFVAFFFLLCKVV